MLALYCYILFCQPGADHVGLTISTHSCSEELACFPLPLLGLATVRLFVDCNLPIVCTATLQL